MMRTLFITATLLFWLAVFGLWIGGPRFTAPAAERAPVESAPVEPVEPRYTLAELAPHDRADDCWMAINGVVYDFTAYLPRHPTPPSMMLDWCGREATEAFRTKTTGRPHTSYAKQLLPQYRIGELHGQ